MFKRYSTPVSLFIFLMLSCADNKTVTDEKRLSSNVTVTKEQEQTTSDEVQDNGIVGTWKLNLEAYDDNSNKVLDDEEKKKGFRNNYLLQFRADGSCRIQGFYNGTYKIKQEGGEKMLSVQRERVKGEETDDPVPDLYYIKSMTKDEMILLASVAGFTHTFWIFKREK